MKLIATLLIVCCTNLAAGAGARGFEFFEPLNPPRTFQVMAHRGLASAAPENSRAAIQMCIDDGLEWAEVDVRLSADGQHILFHDETLNVKTDGTGRLSDHTLAQLKQLDAGSWFAKRFAGTRLLTLEECLALAKDKINLYLDCKQVDAPLLVRQIKSAALEHQVLVFADRATLTRVRELSGGSIAVMSVWRPQDGFDGGVSELRPAAVEIDANEITSEICREFHARGIKVQARMLGTCDQPKFWDKVLADGADYLQTDLGEEVVAHVLARQLQPRTVRLACHRGASRYAPENTLAAFAKAARLHADFVEFDVRPSRDGKYFLLHDASLDRTTNSKGPIRQMEGAAIDGLDAGAWFGRPFVSERVPSLDEFLAAVSPQMNLYFDAKDIPPAALALALAKHSLAERTIVYQGADYLRKVREVDPRIRAMPPARSLAEVDRLAADDKLKPYAVDTPWRVLSKEYIDHCHKAGIQVFADAPGNIDVRGYRQAIEWGIDLVQTDHPLRWWRAMELETAEQKKP